jgi:hypothetical protein
MLPRGGALAVALVITTLRPALAQEKGQLELALPAYFATMNGDRLANIKGMAANFQYFFPGYGMLRGKLEGYQQPGDTVTGENFLEMGGIPLGRYRWTLTGGDFRNSLSPIEFPTQSFFFPELGARGFRIEAGDSTVRYRVGWGQVTLPDGPRITFRTATPQRALEATWERHFGENTTLTAGYLRFNTDLQGAADKPYLFVSQRVFSSVNRVAAQALHRVSEKLKVYGEASFSAARGVSEAGTASVGGLAGAGVLAGATWESERLTFRGSFVRQGTAYLPVAGYFTGDRQGPSGEARVRIFRHLDVYGSAVHYRSNVENRPDVPTFESFGSSGGFGLRLPLRVGLTGAYTQVKLKVVGSTETDRRNSEFSQSTATLTRSFPHNSLRLTARQITSSSVNLSVAEKSADVEDMFTFGHFAAGGTARFQQSQNATQTRNTMYYRGVVRGGLRLLSGYLNLDFGNDLVNRTIFATNVVRSVGFGVAVRLPGEWSLSVDAFKNEFLASLNPESVFLMQTQGLTPGLVISTLNQRNLYIRLARQFQWGGSMPVLNKDMFGGQNIALVGSLEGYVYEQPESDHIPVVGAPVLLDGSRRAITDDKGHYIFEEAAEGRHTVMLSPDELPTEYDVNALKTVAAVVSPKKSTRVDFDAVRLASFSGTFEAPAGMPIDSVIIDLKPGTRYTTPDLDGRFGFYNLPLGDYTVIVKRDSLPEKTHLKGPGEFPAPVRAGAAPPQPRFVLEADIEPPKPVRRLTLDATAATALVPSGAGVTTTEATASHNPRLTPPAKSIDKMRRALPPMDGPVLSRSGWDVVVLSPELEHRYRAAFSPHPPRSATHPRPQRGPVKASPRPRRPGPIVARAIVRPASAPRGIQRQQKRRSVHRHRGPAWLRAKRLPPIHRRRPEPVRASQVGRLPVRRPAHLTPLAPATKVARYGSPPLRPPSPASALRRPPPEL